MIVKKNSPNLEKMMDRLKLYPALAERFEGLLDIMDNSAGDCIKARDAENRVTEEVQKIGNETLTAWAQNQSKKIAAAEASVERSIKHGKKNSTGFQNMEK